ncbi:MAG: hypothetical protein R3313_05235 [Candidatus Saccharimonadales bacterium]|nr:hypothetical protein [Candidatus Saccharimonadales bacterium]
MIYALVSAIFFGLAVISILTDDTYSPIAAGLSAFVALLYFYFFIDGLVKEIVKALTKIADKKRTNTLY